MKPMLDMLAAYTLWADTLIVDRLTSGPDALLDRELGGSFGTLRATLLHVRDAHCAWRLRMAELPMRWPAEESRDIRTLVHHARQLHDQVLASDTEVLSARVRYTNLKGDAFEQPRWQAYLHAFNHGTYHRGQVVTLMRQAGLDAIPGTDLVRFQRL